MVYSDTLNIGLGMGCTKQTLTTCAELHIYFSKIMYYIVCYMFSSQMMSYSIFKGLVVDFLDIQRVVSEQLTRLCQSVAGLHRSGKA